MRNRAPGRLRLWMLAVLPAFAVCAAYGECDKPLAEGWRFAKDASQNADWSAEAFDDTAWEHVCVPHDWAIKGPFLKGEPSGMTGRLPWKGVGWYRLKFDPSKKRVEAVVPESASSFFFNVITAESLVVSSEVVETLQAE